MKKSTPDEVIKRLIELQDETDYGPAHEEADELLCELLLWLGYHDIVRAYHLVGKYYE